VLVVGSGEVGLRCALRWRELGQRPVVLVVVAMGEMMVPLGALWVMMEIRDCTEWGERAYGSTDDVPQTSFLPSEGLTNGADGCVLSFAVFSLLISSSCSKFS